MSHIIKDFFTGSLILVALTIAAFLGSILFFFLNIFFHIFGALAIFFLFIFLIFFAIWLVGFLYRQIIQTGKEGGIRKAGLKD